MGGQVAVRVAARPGEPRLLPTVLLAQQLVGELVQGQRSYPGGGLRRPEVHCAVDDQQLPLHTELPELNVQVGAA
jgi:hypothetical protein